MYIVVDFDGTCVTHEFPHLGHDIGAVDVLKDLVNAGHKLILFTMRSDGQTETLFESGAKVHAGDFLTQAVNWFIDNGIALFGVQTNPTQSRWTSSPKAYGELIIDDAALGCPLIYPKTDSFGNLVVGLRPYVDWVAVRKYLINKKIL